MKCVILKIGFIALLSSALLSRYSYAYSQEENTEGKNLDLSLTVENQQKKPLHVKEEQVRVQDEKKPLLVPTPTVSSNVKIKPYFERPHKENPDKEVTPDGLGIGVVLGI